MKKINLNRIFSVLCMLLMGLAVQAQTTVKGKIVDEKGEGLIGANVIIVGTSTGGNTDLDGNFSITTEQNPPFTLKASYTGYADKEIEVTSGNTTGISITLSEGGVNIDQVVISASRRREKVQEAPASISVISERQLATSAQSTDAVRNLVATPGVQIQQQSAARINIEMRASSGLFGTSVFPIMDYRSLVGPGIGTFDSNAAGISNIDLARIEVVRGPGSALYGPGVSSGVVHFITKNPIDNPGTTIELLGGELNTFGTTIRHAGRNADKTFGYKINAHYKAGDEFTLDPNDPTDAAQIAKLNSTISAPNIANGIVDVTSPGTVLLTESDTDPDGNGNPMQEDWKSIAANVTLEYRPSDNFSAFLSGGYNETSAVFYNNQGEGLSQNSEIWTQLRAQYKGLFAQVFYVDNTGGTADKPTFLYQTGLTTGIARQQLEGQLQYNFELESFLNSNWTVGFDYRQANSDSGNSVYGRNEEDDDYVLYGLYAQGKFKLAEKLDLVLAGRYDRFNFLDDESFSPRAALVYKVNPKHTLRATYNQTQSPPSALQVNIDFPVSIPVPGLFDIWLYGQKTEQTWNNPSIDITVPGVPNLPVGTPGLPLSIPYGLTAGAVVPGVIQALGADPATAPLVPVIQGFFDSYTPAGTTGTFSQYNIFNGQPMPELNNTLPARLTTTESYELGYKGLLGDKFGVMVDFYTVKRTGFTQFTAVGPTVALVNPDIPNDLGNTVATDLEAFLIANAGLPQAVAAQIAGLVGGGFNQAGVAADQQLSPLYSIFGAIESDQVPQNDDIVHVPAGYRTFADESYDYWGLDVGLEYYFTSDISAFFNYSYVSQNLWVPGEDNDDGLPFRWNLGVPQNKFRLGVNYTPEEGIRGSILFQHDDSFFADFGQFTGDVEARDLVDMSIGYQFNNGLAIDVSAQNVFNSEYRAFPNFPLIGRRVIGKVVYTFGADED